MTAEKKEAHPLHWPEDWPRTRPQDRKPMGSWKRTANQYRVTPLMSASLEGEIEMVKLLLARGAKVTSRDPSGGTALSCAVLRGHLDIARMLISAGADVRRDRSELLDLARGAKNKEMERFIAHSRNDGRASESHTPR